MPKLHRFERVILAWTLIAAIGVGPLFAGKKFVAAPKNLIFVSIPQGTKSVTLSWSVAASVLPDRTWDCANGGTVITYTYGPDHWAVGIIDANTSAQVAQREGDLAPDRFSCPGTIPAPTQITGSAVIDVSAYTADGDTTFLVGGSSTSGVRTATPGGSSPYFACDGSAEEMQVDGTIDFAPITFTFDMVAPERLLTYIAPADKDTAGNPNYPSIYQRRTSDQFAGVALGAKPQMFIRGVRLS